MVDQQESDAYETVGPPVFSDDGERVGFGAVKGRELWWKVLEVPWGTIPSSVTGTIPAPTPPGTRIVFQALALDGKVRAAGNLSNAVLLDIE